MTDKEKDLMDKVEIWFYGDRLPNNLENHKDFILSAYRQGLKDGGEMKK